MQTMFKNFQVISHTFVNGRDSLLVRMHTTGTHYTLVRGLDLEGLFKLEMRISIAPSFQRWFCTQVITDNRVVWNLPAQI